MVAPSSTFSRRFDLPLKSLLPTSSGFVDIAADTGADILQSILQDEPFPGREIRLGQVALEASPGKSIKLGKPGAWVSFGGIFRGRAGLAVLDTPQSVLSELDLGAQVPLPLRDALTAEKAPVRYVLFRAGYEARGSISGRHPIGAFGSLGFGASEKYERLFAVIHRIEPATGAHTAIRRTLAGVVLPRDVDEPEDLAPGTMLLTEVEGSVAMKIAAGLGYDFAFVRDTEALGLTGDVGLQIDLGLKATLGFNAGGRYLVAVDRHSLDESSRTLRVRLFRLSRNRSDFGLSLAARAISKDPLPDGVDDFVRAMFGLHGQQVARELKRIEEWTDASADLPNLVAGLTSEEGLKLLRRVTGINPTRDFDAARRKLVQAVDLWESLPEGAVAAAARLMASVAGNEKAREEVVAALSLIAEGDSTTRRAELLRLLGVPGFERTALGALLAGIGTHGLFDLLEDAGLPSLAALLRSVVDGGEVSRTLERLQSEVRDALDLQPVIDAVQEADFDALNGWLVGRLSTVLDERFDFGKLKPVQKTIHGVLALRHKVYDRAVQALERRCNFSLAAAWQTTAVHTALLDAEFDLQKPSAQAMLQRLLRDADYDALLMQAADGVALHKGVMSHSVERRCSVEVNLPCYKTREMKFTKAMATVEAEEDQGRVLVYGLDAEDKVTAVNRSRSQVSASAALIVPGRNVRGHRARRAAWTYSLRMARHDMCTGELRILLRPLLEQYLPGHFPERPGSSVDQWVTDLEREVARRTGNGPGELGDVLLAVEVGLSQGVLAAWLKQREQREARDAARRASLRLQSRLKRLLSFYFFQDLDRLFQNESACALLVWAALPPAAAMPDSDNVYWDWMEADRREDMVQHRETAENLAALLAEARARLLGAGRRRQAGYFDPSEINDHIEASNYRKGALFCSLLSTEAATVEAVRNVILDVNDFWRDQSTLASRAIERLADFGVEITRMFHSRLGSVYGKRFLRPLGSMLFLEAARALEPALESVTPEAMLALIFLRENAGYRIESYLDNVLPAEAAVVLEQRLVAAVT